MKMKILRDEYISFYKDVPISNLNVWFWSLSAAVIFFSNTKLSGPIGVNILVAKPTDDLILLDWPTVAS